MHDDAGNRLVQLEKRPQRGILEGLELIENGGLAGIVTVGDILQEQLNLLARNDVADVFRPASEPAERESDHLVAGDGRSTAVAGIDRGVNLDAQSGNRIVVGGEVDAGDDAFGDGEARASGGESVDHHGVFHLGQRARPRQRAVGIEERLVVELEDRQINARSN